MRLEELHALFEFGRAGKAADEGMRQIGDEIERPIRGDHKVRGPPPALGPLAPTDSAKRRHNPSARGDPAATVPCFSDLAKLTDQFVARGKVCRGDADEVCLVRIALESLQYMHVHWQNPAAVNHLRQKLDPHAPEQTTTFSANHPRLR